MTPLGVGLVWWPALAPLFDAGADAPAVLELEPQALWRKESGPGGWRYVADDAALARIARLPQAKLLHGVGQPLGGVCNDPIEHFSLLRQAADRLQPAWVSEHLSFNRVRRNGSCDEAGFLLPPRQCEATVAVAAQRIHRYTQALGRPCAFETGVNYLRPRPGEIDDGAFFGAVAERAGCGIVLDLHNLWCNERNGRQRIADALAQLPLDRIWELHLAGGMPLDGYWLDAHCDAVPPALIDIAAEVVPQLPQLGAIVFEILPEHLPRFGLDGVARQLEQLRDLWKLRLALAAPVVPAHETAVRAAAPTPPTPTDIDQVQRWEAALVNALSGSSAAQDADTGLSGDPGLDILRRLIGDARRAALARALRYTTSALLAGLGRDTTHALLDAYFAAQPPDAFPALEASRFAAFLQAQPALLACVPWLNEIVAFEAALIGAALFGSATEINWSVDPTALLGALDAGYLPARLVPQPSTMRIA